MSSPESSTKLAGGETAPGNVPGAVSDSLRKALLLRSDRTHVQFIRYLFVGGFAAAMDTGILYLLYRHVGIDHLIAAAIGFLAGLLVNYLVSIAWVFKSSGNFRQEFLLFSVIGLGGLGWTELIMWSSVDLAGAPVMAAKALALALVLLWNFGMRKKLVFSS